MSQHDTRAMGGPQPFPATSWNMVRQCQQGAPPGASDPLARLFRDYWGPVYFYVRRNWHKEVEEAKDLTQAFFLTFLEKGFIESFDAERGRFRTFVCTALKHWLHNQHRAARAAKRNPAEGLVSFDRLALADARFDLPAAEADSPDAQFQADWKRAVIAAALERLRGRAEGTAKAPMVDLFIRYDIDRDEAEQLRYADLAASAGLTVHQVTTGLHWARRTFQEVLLEELRDQVGSEEDLASEVWALFGLRL